MYKVSSHLLSPQLLHSLSSGHGSEVVLGRRPKVGKENILGLEHLLADFLLGHLGKKEAQLNGENLGNWYPQVSLSTCQGGITVQGSWPLTRREGYF